jgi:hypothetical protein
MLGLQDQGWDLQGCLQQHVLGQRQQLLQLLPVV